MSGDICYYVIAAPDSERARAFYGSVLGWRFEPGNVPGGIQISSTTPPGGIGPADRPELRVYFEVDDIGAAVGRVRDRGGEAGETQRSEAGAYAHCRDDQGVEFGLFQFPPDGHP